MKISDIQSYFCSFTKNIDNSSLQHSYWQAIGDSLTENNEWNDNNSYVNLINKKTGIRIYNDGNKFKGYGDKEITLLNNKPNIVTVFLGTNDILSNKTLGKYNKDIIPYKSGLIGRINYIHNLLANYYSDSNIGIIIPPMNEYCLKSNGELIKNKYGYTILDINKAIINSAERFNYPILDLSDDKYLNPYENPFLYNEVSKPKVYLKGMGQQILAIYIEKFIREKLL